MISVLHGRLSTTSLGLVLLCLVALVGGAAVFVPAVTLAIRFYNSDPSMSIFTLFGAAGWIVCTVWLTRSLRNQPGR